MAAWLMGMGFRFGIAFRYVAREVLLVFAGVLSLLLAVGLGGRFIGFLQEAAAGRFTPEALWLLVALRVPEFIQVTVPFALFLALLLTLGRLHAEREYVALAVGGLGRVRLTLWLMALALPVAAVVVGLAFKVTPEARRLYADLSLEQLVDSELDAVTPGAFHVYGDGRRVTYARVVDRDENRLEGVFMAERDGQRTVTVWAERGRQHRDPRTGARYLELENGTRYEGAPGTANYRTVTFARLGQRLDREPLVPLADVRRLPTAELDAGDPRQAAELQWRWSLPVMTAVAALLAIGIARSPPRAGRFARLLPGLGVFVGYYLLLVFAQDLVAERVLPAKLGLWSVHGAVFVLALALVQRRG